MDMTTCYTPAAHFIGCLRKLTTNFICLGTVSFQSLVFSPSHYKNSCNDPKYARSLNLYFKRKVVRVDLVLENMVKASYVEENGVRKGAWSEEEDQKLRAYVLSYGFSNWELLPKYAGLERCGKSCRQRWMNYLKPGVKRGNYTKEEEDLIKKLHGELGNKWSAIAARLPGRTDNDIKNYWHTHVKKLRNRSSKSGQRIAENFQDQTSSKRASSKSFKTAISGGEVTSVAQTSSSRRQEKPELSSEIYILESSGSLNDLVSGSVHGDMDSIVDQNCSEILCGSSDSVAFKWEINSSSDSFSGFHENFWTEPFEVDASYSQDCNFSTLESGDCWAFRTDSSSFDDFMF